MQFFQARAVTMDIVRKLMRYGGVDYILRHAGMGEETVYQYAALAAVAEDGTVSVLRLSPESRADGISLRRVAIVNVPEVLKALLEPGVVSPGYVGRHSDVLLV